jgi:hypothetical protein
MAPRRFCLARIVCRLTNLSSPPAIYPQGRIAFSSQRVGPLSPQPPRIGSEPNRYAHAVQPVDYGMSVWPRCPLIE